MLTDLSRVVVAAGRKVAAEVVAVAFVRALISPPGQRLGRLMLEVQARETLEPEYLAGRIWASVMSMIGLTAQDVGESSLLFSSLLFLPGILRQVQ